MDELPTPTTSSLVATDSAPPLPLDERELTMLAPSAPSSSDSTSADGTHRSNSPLALEDEDDEESDMSVEEEEIPWPEQGLQSLGSYLHENNISVNVPHVGATIFASHLPQERYQSDPLGEQQQEQPPPHPQEEEEEEEPFRPMFPLWTQCTSSARYFITRAVVSFSRRAATHPKRVVVGITLLSLLLPPIGWFSGNFQFEVEQEAILAPFHSLTRQHAEWIEDSSDFPKSTRPYDLLIHQDGENVLTKDCMRRVFQALEVVRQTKGYNAICKHGGAPLGMDSIGRDDIGERTCRIHAATRFWFHNATLFEEQVANDQDLKTAVAADKYPLGTPVGDHDFIMGNYFRDEMVRFTNPYHYNAVVVALAETINITDLNQNSGDNEESEPTTVLLSTAQSYIIRIDLPVVGMKTFQFEDLLTEELLELRQAWIDDVENPVRLEIFTFRSIPNEFTRAIKLDLPLYPAVFFIMCAFACITFFRRDRVHSRCLLGIGSVVTVCWSLFTGTTHGAALVARRMMASGEMLTVS